jgi:hypothetical protein
MLESGIRRKSLGYPVDAASQAAIQEHLVAIWEGLFDVSPINVQQNFFDLGGDALLAAGMTCKIEELIGTRLPVLSVFKAPTIEQLANAICSEVKDNRGNRRTFVA